ncbi:MAG: 16S rRNA (guanine(527)-N(7))-methyltransferase RsmG [Methyloversatilis sp.]|jgi:16S rRNA (guanine527-N7)-methyltransferase|nr:16S rRNA (guanine(527)-N(7))-methyltransferase RsmG [Methyloversatilis sp.]MBP6193437.1 16S rRNA (guanine(527)-N(7))-methyltransferase RsmG [Methyloversatilis sp.]MBP9118062.1 16S rRNA (guanine(527)-N(7))-methyltransferase RsmG [Methyloversatilis sp.]
MTLQNELDAGLAALDLSLSGAARTRLLRYIALMTKWNAVYNLTAIREESRMLTHHLLDALSIERFIPEGSTLADIGSGGGVPGMPLAIARPDLDVLSIEPNSKKASFQQQVRIDLGLENFDVQTARAEAVQLDPGRDFIVSRAFGDLADFIKVAGHLLKPNGRMLAMKGVYPDEEVRAIPAGWKLVRAEELQVPGVEGARHLLWLARDSAATAG